MNWVLVLIAGLLEVVWASSLKHADSLLDWIMILILIAISFMLLIRSYRKIPMAAAYTVFVGIGTVGTYITGVVLGESFSAAQMFFLALLLAGILGMKLFTKESKTQSGGDS
ncbi:DMT family transporter [Bacillus vallismortis]|uniref:Multidrug efflux SMR transporter n=1 Tax=Bacillus vallismortis TaxID=72361 RepID=A0AAP3CG89_BACVA|nr:multidrug efflux SMR transporter [Bacillus vallismortis]MBG9770358.1 membrane protein [Bacillus vallismortis]MCO4852999.1 multidrug efflux SMR transporter [Bacillus vallismortis]MCY7916101.1 multidrug efflux SMR transporter [Bacillus vallismortis]MCY8307552.1 multidrug efflux SMR transporter [Bacillus vallismortis]MCY8315972.1 multidrug efflux SMR transporter [Bacillus vallismortis]